MNNLIQTVQNGSLIGKSLFLMCCGILSVFLVQVIFYLIIRIWPKKKGGKAEG